MPLRMPRKEPPGDLVMHLVRFARAVRQHDMVVGLSEEIDAASALAHVDIGDRNEVRLALRATFRIRYRDWQAFDELFARLWGLEGSACDLPSPPPAVAPESAEGFDEEDARWRPPRAEAPAAGGGAQGSRPAYSPDLLLRSKSFEACSEIELEAIEHQIARLVRKLATRRSRRLVPSNGRGLVDLRRSLRRGIDLIDLAARRRAIEQPKLVMLCDTSGSMDAYSRFLLEFMVALKRRAHRTEVFAFNTSLSRLTPWLANEAIEEILSRLIAEVPDWSGDTRIGECLLSFVDNYLLGLVDARTVLVILSDGLDRGDPEKLVEAMGRLRARARRLIWLNPLLGDPRYRAEARGMKAALPFIDHFAAAHNLESLAQLIPYLVA
ncbi:MAG: VWA domain-containing protein [Acidobacteriota bacterium]